MTNQTPTTQPPTVHTVLCRVRDTMTPDNTCRGAEWTNSKGEPGPVQWSGNEGRKSFHQHVALACYYSAYPVRDAVDQLYQGCLEALANAAQLNSVPLSTVMILSHNPNYGFADCQIYLDRAIEATKPKPVLRKWRVSREHAGTVEAETKEQALEIFLQETKDMEIYVTEVPSYLCNP